MLGESVESGVRGGMGRGGQSWMEEIGLMGGEGQRGDVGDMDGIGQVILTWIHDSISYKNEVQGPIKPT